MSDRDAGLEGEGWQEVRRPALPITSLWCRLTGHEWHEQKIAGHGWGEMCGRCKAMRAES